MYVDDWNYVFISKMSRLFSVLFPFWVKCVVRICYCSLA
jgi:hypothetical protein